MFHFAAFFYDFRAILGLPVPYRFFIEKNVVAMFTLKYIMYSV